MWSTEVAKAVAAIDGVLGARGQWPGWVVMENAPHESRRDMAPPLTALGMLCLGGVPGAQEVLSRSREHLELTVLPGGVWRYYANIPWDTDDTAMCALALGADHPLVDATRDSLHEAQIDDGRYLTWPTMARSEQGLDAVANAHVIGALGPQRATPAAVQWISDLVEDHAEVANCCYYPDPLDLHMAISRAVSAGVNGLEPVLAKAVPRALDRLVDEKASSYRRAQAIVVAIAGGVPARELLAAGARLAAQQDSDGFWAPETLYFAISTAPAGGRCLYTSQAVTTALCAKALTMLGDS